MTNNVQLSESLNERGNRSYTSNFVSPKTADRTAANLYIVCATVGPGVMYRGEQVAEKVSTDFTNYINQQSPTTHAEADAQAEMMANALIYTEAQLSEYNILHPECHGITATLACIHFTENGAIVGWVGDTRAVLIRGGMLIKQTVDHSTKYPYDDFSMHPRRNVNRIIEGTEKPTTIDVEWWNDLQPNDIIVLGTYAIMRPLEQGFLGDAWERDEMRHAIKLACDAHARDNYAITTIRMGEALVVANDAPMAFAMAAPILGVELAEINTDAEPSFESETAPIVFATEPSLESETAPIAEGLDAADMVEIDAEVGGGLEDSEDETEEEVTADLNETESVEVIQTPIVDRVETPAVVTTEIAPIIGNYKYEDEEEETTGGITWIPTAPKVEDSTIPANTPITEPIIEPITAPVAAVSTPIITTPIIPTIMDNINNTTTNIGNTAKDTTTNIVDFTPVSDKTKAKVAETASSTKTSLGNWGWLIAAAMLFVGLAVWFGQSIFGGIDKELSVQVERGMETKLEGALTPADKIAVYEEYKTMVTTQYKGQISEGLVKKIDDGLANTNSMMAQADGVGASDMNGTTSALADNAASDAKIATAAADAAAKEAVTEAAVKTKPAIASTIPSVPVTDSGALPKAKTPVVKAKIKDAAPKADARMGRPVPGAKVVGGVNTVKADPLKAFDKVWAESEGFRVVSKGGKWGWIKADNSSLIAPIYEECGSFHNGMAAVKKGGKWGFTNAAGKLVVAYKYKSITAFSAKCPGLAHVNDGAKMTYIDAAGKETVACK